VAGQSEERTRYLCLLFVSLVVAEWKCTGIRHKLRGKAPTRALFVGLDPWLGFNLGPLSAEPRPGSGSIVVNWTGTCSDAKQRAGLLTGLRQVAHWHEARWNAASGDVTAGWKALAIMRGRAVVPDQPAFRWFDDEFTGRIFISPDVAEDQKTLLDEARRDGVTIEECEIDGSTHHLLRLEALDVRGVDFRCFDPRGLYPTEDRVSFVFIERPRTPCLHGRLVMVSERRFNEAAYAAPVNSADWFVRGPSVHLRGYFEEWMADLLAWVRFFFIRRLASFQRDAYESVYARRLATFEDLEATHGADRGSEHFLERLRLEFAVEADRCAEELLGG
jgi:hypothetical protein